MPCCNKRPVVFLAYKSVFFATVTWNDHGCTGDNTRQLRWHFYINGILRYTTPWGLPSDVLPIGTNSTYTAINASATVLTEYLHDQQAVNVSDGDSIKVIVEALNCEEETGRSNPVVVFAVIPESDCECEFSVGIETGQTGDTADLDGFDDTNGLLVFRNGQLNYAGIDFTDAELVAEDVLEFLSVTNCDAVIEKEEVSGEVGTVTIPSGFTSLNLNAYLLFRNGVLQRGFSQGGGVVTPAGAASESEDAWMFVRLDSEEGCRFGSQLVVANKTGSTFTMPTGFTFDNFEDWRLFRNGLLMTPELDYGMDGSILELTTPASGEDFWIVKIM